MGTTYELGLPQGRKEISELVKRYESALTSEDVEVFWSTREKLNEWTYVLAKWYLSHTGLGDCDE